MKGGCEVSYQVVRQKNASYFILKMIEIFEVKR